MEHLNGLEDYRAAYCDSLDELRNCSVAKVSTAHYFFSCHQETAVPGGFLIKKRKYLPG
jgi:hypothetical protein